MALQGFQSLFPIQSWCLVPQTLLSPRECCGQPCISLSNLGAALRLSRSPRSCQSEQECLVRAAHGCKIVTQPLKTAGIPPAIG